MTRKGGDIMDAVCITSRNYKLFNKYLEELLSIYRRENRKVIDIKFSTCVLPEDENDYSMTEYSALILLNDKKDREENVCKCSVCASQDQKEAE